MSMKRVLINLIAGAALVAPTTALAPGGLPYHHSLGVFAKLSGTGSSFSGTTASATGSVTKGSRLDSGTFTASLTTNWSAATSKTFDKGTLACAPATATLNVTGTPGNAVSSNLTGKTCSFTKTDGTVVRSFFGRGMAGGTGTFAGLNGLRAKLWLFQRSDGTVNGAAWVAGMAKTNVLSVKGDRTVKHTSGHDDH